MKKLLNKISRKKKPAGLQNESSSSLRITNETVAEHRERILAGGRKFKYPLQYPKYRIVVMTVLIVLFFVVALSGIGFWQLYGAQNTSQFAYRITQVVPVPVGQVDGQQIRYSDYLLELRSALHYLSTKEAVNFSSDDGKRQLDYQKRLALNKAIQNAYVQKLAKEHDLSVNDSEINDFIDQEISNNSLGVTEEVYRQVIKDYYDWTFEDYRDSVKRQLLRKKVVAKVDTEGRKKAEDIVAAANKGSDFVELAKKYSEDPLTKDKGGDLGFLNKNIDDPNKLISIAESLKPGQVSNVIEGTDGFYIIKLVENRQNDIHFMKIFISYKTFGVQLAQLRGEQKITEYINVPEVVDPTDIQSRQ